MRRNADRCDDHLRRFPRARAGPAADKDPPVAGSAHARCLGWPLRRNGHRTEHRIGMSACVRAERSDRRLAMVRRDPTRTNFPKAERERDAMRASLQPNSPLSSWRAILELVDAGRAVRLSKSILEPRNSSVATLFIHSVHRDDLRRRTHVVPLERREMVVEGTRVGPRARSTAMRVNRAPMTTLLVSGTGARAHGRGRFR